ncbi:MAG: asparagine synthase (glutamine-hydrolyzing) [Oscillospiraceae bacterium]|nr:asparagine synthase (glutamine-hydrolyzing) [Oscillospiraceae bacterium]
MKVVVVMCGICGVWDARGGARAWTDVVDDMVSALRHRGPDDRGVSVYGGVTLGFARLSIVDLRTGMQPMTSEDGSVVSICNGEIYNYRALRQELAGRGHVFRTQCDVEVIPHLYEEYGIDFLKRLNGQFAVALYDMRRGALYCARDPLGIAPLFYTQLGGVFLFASEIKALLRYPGVPRRIDLTALDQVLTFPGVVSPRTMFQGICSLPGGQYLRLDGEGLALSEYWDLTFDAGGETREESYYSERLDALLSQAVRYRLNADVPVGFYVSGGLDSSIIAAKVGALGGDVARHSFSIDFARKDISERLYQKLVTRRVRSIHHERIFGTDSILEHLKKVVYHSESALKETYNTASVILSELVRAAGIKVVLTGEGADELFGGYVGYKFDKMRRMSGVDPSCSDEDRALNERLWGDPLFVYEKNHASFMEKKRALYAARLREAMHEFECTASPPVDVQRLRRLDPLQKRSYLDCKLRLADHLLADHGDRMAYANSVEARYPFLDLEVVNFAACVPSELKLKGLDEKYILKKMAQAYVPPEILKRPKFAFVAPGSADILRENDEYIMDLLSYETVKRQGFFDPDAVERMKRTYSAEGFTLHLPYDNDMLIIVITLGILLDIYRISGA